MLFLTPSCAPTILGAGPDIGEPRLTHDAVFAADGARLPLRSWLPAGPPKAVVLALHGMNDYSDAFDGPGWSLARRGIAVYAYDQRGFGAGPEPGYWAGEDTLANDMITVARVVSGRFPGVPFYLLGESMGGAVAMVGMALPDAPKVTGMILSAPAVWGRDSMNIFQRTALFLASYTLPWMTVTGHGLQIQPSDNLEMLDGLSRDPLVIKETRVDAVHGLCNLMDRAETVVPRLRLPVLILYGERDEVVPAEPVHRIMTQLPGHPVRAIYAKGYHMLLRDLQAEVVLGDIAFWIENPDLPLPSGADERARKVLAGKR